MIDFRSVETLLVFKNDDHVANLKRIQKGCEFRYTGEFLSSNQEPIALHLPKTQDGIKVEGLSNLPTYFAGLLPEGIMFSAVKTLIGSASDDLFAVLAATGSDAIGDIEVRVPGEPEREPTINLEDAADIIDAILSQKATYLQNHFAAIPGVQPKMSLGEIIRVSRKTKYIAKFDSSDFRHLIQNEFVFMSLARRCKLNVASVKQDANALLVERFDRTFNSYTNLLEKVHIEDMLQVMDLFPNSKYSMEYINLMAAMDGLGVSKATLLDALRIFVFSYIIGNGDLHAKNVSLVQSMDTGQWSIAPGYDLLSTLPYKNVLPGADRMALALRDESYGRFTLEELVDFGQEFGLPEKAVVKMVDRTAKAVSYFLPGLAQSILSEEVIETILGRANFLMN